MSASNLTIKDLYADALELPEVQREAFVRASAAQRPEIAQAVLGLLRAASQHSLLLAEAGGAALGKLSASAAAATGRLAGGFDAKLEGPGTVLGKYVLCEVLGEGGFGVVYRAEQSEPVRRQVALKILKPGMDTRAVVSRFRAEQEALALMDHPGIAKVLDAGSTPTGRPFVVMELVGPCRGEAGAGAADQGLTAAGGAAEGTSSRAEVITAYCDRKKLPIRQRIALAIEICMALQHAHGKGVIHRDIKPSNVLVAEVDGVAKAKMIDFGIAKAVRPGTLSGVQTEQWQLVGTPEHMAPEQLSSAAGADVRTDVYGLGTLLYELLCGATPFDSAALRSMPLDQLQRTIFSSEAPAPSTRLTALADAQLIAERRESSVAGLKAQLRGELDWIVQRCLAKEPQRRYQTAAAVGDDLRRWTEHRPIEAGPATAAYTVSKWLRRHRGLAVAALAVGAAVAAGLVGTAVAMVEAGRERALAVASATEAKRQAGRAEKVTRFLLDDMFGSLRPEVSLGREITVREIAQTATDRMRLRFGDDDLTRITMQTTLADVWLKIGETQRARDLYAETLELAERLFGPDAPELVEVLIGYAASLEFSGDHAGQQNLARRALKIVEAGDFPANAPIRLKALLALAAAQRFSKDLDEAKALFDRLPSFENDNTELGVIALILKSDLMRDSSTMQPRIAVLEQALARNIELVGPDHPRNHEIRTKLAYAYLDQGRFVEAERLISDARVMADRLFSPESVQAAEVQRLLARSLAGQDRLIEAAQAYIRSVDISAATLGETNMLTRATMGSAADTAALAGMLPEALEMSRRELAAERSLGSGAAENFMNASRRNGRLLLEAGQYGQALAVTTEALLLADRVHSPFRIGLRRLAGDALLANGRVGEADTAFVEAVSIAVDYLGENNARINEVLAHASRSLTRTGRPDLAEKFATLETFRFAMEQR